MVLGRSFVKRFALGYPTVVLSVCPVYDIGVSWPNGWTDEDETWHGARPRPRPHCVRCGPSCLPKKGGHNSPPTFRPMYCGHADGWIKMPLGTEEGPRPRTHCVRGRPSSPRPPKRGIAAPNFRPMSVVAKRLYGSRCHLVGR